MTIVGVTKCIDVPSIKVTEGQEDVDLPEVPQFDVTLPPAFIQMNSILQALVPIVGDLQKTTADIAAAEKTIIGVRPELREISQQAHLLATNLEKDSEGWASEYLWIFVGMAGLMAISYLAGGLAELRRGWRLIEGRQA